MKLNTRHFDEIDVDIEKIIIFPNGLLGFEDCNRFIILKDPEEDTPFNWLQSIDNPDLAFVIMNPFVFKKDYEFNIPDSVVKELKIRDEIDVTIYTILVVPEDINKMTANLIGPLVININAKLGKQIILNDDRYTTKHLILNELQNSSQEE